MNPRLSEVIRIKTQARVGIVIRKERGYASLYSVFEYRYKGILAGTHVGSGATAWIQSTLRMYT